jgi:hypothetical protein
MVHTQVLICFGSACWGSTYVNRRPVLPASVKPIIVKYSERRSIKVLNPPRLVEDEIIEVIAPLYPVRPIQEKRNQSIENLKKLGFRVKAEL